MILLIFLIALFILGLPILGEFVNLATSLAISVAIVLFVIIPLIKWALAKCFKGD